MSQGRPLMNTTPSVGHLRLKSSARAKPLTPSPRSRSVTRTSGAALSESVPAPPRRKILGNLQPGICEQISKHLPHTILIFHQQNVGHWLAPQPAPLS